MYLVRLSITADTGLVGVNDVEAGPVHTVFTVTGTSTAEPKSTVQVRLGEEPANIVPTGAVIITEVGAGIGEICIIL